ncbi:MAG TPA: ABC transporter substrate-binding protein [Burkholderiaceae bacterium]|nr:ABC transporter substrate-binding protein [Burkholderiaceae bacterium]
MKRRDLAFGLAVGAVLAPVCGIAQQKSARIGVLSSSSSSQSSDTSLFRDHFLPTLANAGWVEGRNLVIDWRFADGKLERHGPLAQELVALKPDLILAATQPSAVAVMKATKTIPIVFALVQEPVSVGLAESLARPGKNATGLASMNMEILSKRIEFLLEVVPSAKRVALLYQPELDLNARQTALAQQVLQSLRLAAVKVPIGGPETFGAAFERLAHERPDAVLVIENPSVFTNRVDVVKRMAAIRLPAMYGFQPFALDGGLMSYSIDFNDQFRRAAGYVDQILRGRKPADLPIQQPQAFEFTVNLKAANELGITIPQSVLLRANQVIE